MRVTKWGELGILSLAFIATRPSDSTTPTTTNAGSIAAALGVDVDYARQVLQRLKNAQLVATVRGPSGGYRLTKEPMDITIEEILLATEGATFQTLCNNKPLHSDCHSPVSPCNLRTLWDELAVHITSFLQARTLQNILDLNPDWAPGPTSVTLVNIARLSRMEDSL